MKTYAIEINETLSKVIEIEANTEEEALQKIKDLYQKESIVLDAEDFVTVEFLKVEEKFEV